MELTQAERHQVIDQARELIEQLYVHLPLKRAMHAVDPVQRLKVLKSRCGQMLDRPFHDELLATFGSVHDLHTVYSLPEPYKDQVAVLPFRLQRYFDADVPRYIVTAAAPGLADGAFTVGVEVTHWNGVPIHRAVERNGDLTSAGNRDARLARGLEAMAQRPLVLLPHPQEDWNVITFRSGDQERGVRLTWQVVELVPVAPPSRTSNTPGAPSPSTLGIDRLVEDLQRVRKSLFSPDLVAMEQRVTDGDPSVDLSVVSSIPHALWFRVIGPPDRPVGYLRIENFQVPDVDAFVLEVVRILGLLPADGLIIDVRGNPGGAMAAGERLLQLFTARSIEPAPCHFISTPLTQQLVSEQPWLAAWRPSMERAVELGATYSDGHPIEAGHVERCNDLGQQYFGPVVLIVDALSYSATDVFAAGFQDHEIGPVLGTDASTGAGGANGWDHTFLTELLPGPFPPLPGGAQLSVAVRQTRRVGSHAGDLLEDLGVAPDVLHRTTRADLLEGNVDLLARATELLETMPRRRLHGVVDRVETGRATVRLTTAALSFVDIFVDGRQRGTLDVTDGDHEVDVPTGGGSAPQLFDLRGYDGGALVARRRITG